MECMRQYISELLDFIADMHTLTKLKVSLVFHVSATTCRVSYVEVFSYFAFCSAFFSLQHISNSEPYEGVLSAAAWGHLWGESESGPGTGRCHGDQQRQSPWQQSCSPLSSLALSSTIHHATRVRITKLKMSLVRIHRLKSSVYSNYIETHFLMRL